MSKAAGLAVATTVSPSVAEEPVWLAGCSRGAQIMEGAEFRLAPEGCP